MLNFNSILLFSENPKKLAGFYKEVFELVLPYAGPRSCFIVGGIHESREKRKWWEQIVTSESTGITFDLYDIGLVFFDKARYKQHYIVNFL